MSALDTSIADVNSRIHDMYEEDSLHQYEYRLHAVMVHEGGVDSGHYWAYVQDHRDESLIRNSSERNKIRCVEVESHSSNFKWISSADLQAGGPLAYHGLIIKSQ